MATLDGYGVLVTGGGSGIGRAAAHVMAREGATVAVADIRIDAAEQVAASAGNGAAAFLVDVRDAASVESLVAAVVARFGRIDALFHTAMSVPLINGEDRRITELPDATWHAILAITLTGTFNVAKHVARQMLAQRAGSIVLTATVDALLGQAGIDAYTAGKGGVVAMTRSMAAGLSPDGVRVNCICPGFVETPHQRTFLDDPASRRRIEDMHLLPILQSEDVAELAAFLASNRAKAITGAIHACDGGYSAFKGRLDVMAVFQGKDNGEERA
jgi:NAD(P)-dependent dehydrogenase (short-subunit alcohol dehydrogenase family)